MGTNPHVRAQVSEAADAEAAGLRSDLEAAVARAEAAEAALSEAGATAEQQQADVEELRRQLEQEREAKEQLMAVGPVGGWRGAVVAVKCRGIFSDGYVEDSGPGGRRKARSKSRRREACGCGLPPVNVGLAVPGVGPGRTTPPVNPRPSCAAAWWDVMPYCVIYSRCTEAVLVWQ